MQRWSRHFFLACVLAVSAGATTAHAAPKDAAAQKLYDEAMDEDYLNTDFDKAIGKLSKGIAGCGANKCSPKVLSNLHLALGTVYGGGKNNKVKAKAHFVKALALNPDAKPLEDFMTDGLKKLFAEAKKATAGKPGAETDKPRPEETGKPTPAPGGDLDYEPPSEALLNTPLPIFVKVSEDLGAEALKLRYKAFGAVKWESIKMRKVGGGFGAVIPCTELTSTGDLKLYIIIKDDEGDPIDTAGTRKAPLVVKIRRSIAGSQPSLPGESAPKVCAQASDCPPDFPGCAAKGSGERGDKGWGSTCDSTRECQAGLACIDGTCEQGDGSESPDDGKKSGNYPKNFVYAGLQLDLLVIDGAQNVCGSSTNGADFQQDLSNYFCYYPDGGGEYLGKPDKDKFNEIEGGLGVAGARVLIGYDRLLWGGLGAGVRLGYAFGGSPDVGDAAERFEACKATQLNTGGNPADCRQPRADNFVPWHAEVRANYFFPGPQGMLGGLVKPYAFAGFGLIGQINAGVNVATCDHVDDDGATRIAGGGAGKCSDGTKKRDDIEAFQVTGLNFVNFGVGSIFAITETFGANLELKAMVMFPTVGVVLAPSISPVVMF